MEIGKAIGAQNLTVIESKNSISAINSLSQEGDGKVLSGGGNTSNQISLSSSGKLAQQIDQSSEQLDDILLRHVTAEQKDTLNGIYQKLDNLFDKGELTEKDEKSADELFEQVHNILETSINKLSESEHQQVDKLVTKMDGLMMQLDQSDANRSPSDSTINGAMLANNTSVDSLLSSSGRTEPENKKSKSVAELNALSALELNKLSAQQLKKLNSKQLNKLNSSQLNSLGVAQLRQLSPSNVEKLNASQTHKLS